jgi:hypothetical protein
MSGLLAHGGAAGAASETVFVLVPIVVFALLGRSARLRRERDEEEAAAAGAPGHETASDGPEPGTPVP